MIRLKVAEHLKRRGWTAYRLAKEAGLSIPVAYRLGADKGTEFRRLDLGTLDALCRTLMVQPGELLEWLPARNEKQR
jgi:DNA-binding Xre family transcriptional regulator